MNSPRGEFVKANGLLKRPVLTTTLGFCIGPGCVERRPGKRRRPLKAALMKRKGGDVYDGVVATKEGFLVHISDADKGNDAQSKGIGEKR
jgi:hypothetical protein